MATFTDPTKAAKLERLVKARDGLAPVLTDAKKWSNDCESVFSEFRVGVVHLRKEPELLDSLDDKKMVWSFLTKLSKERKPFWNRTEEVLNILMTSDAWMKAFADDPDMNVNDLPTNIIKEFEKRVDEVAHKPEDAPKGMRLAIVGCGATALRQLSLIVGHNAASRIDSTFRVVALCDADPARVAALLASPQAATLKLAEAVDARSIDDLLAKDCFDVAAIFTHVDRERLVTTLLKQKKLVYVESPLAAEPEVASRLVTLSRQDPVLRLVVGETGASWSEARQARDAVAGNQAGLVTAAEGYALLTGPEADEALAEGLSCDQVRLPRWARALQLVLGPIEEVAAYPKPVRSGMAPPAPAPPPPSGGGGGWFSKGSAAAAPAGPPPSESSAAVMLRHRSGAVSSLQLQLGGPRPYNPPPDLVFRGSLGDVVVTASGDCSVEPSDTSLEGRKGAAATNSAFAPSVPSRAEASSASWATLARVTTAVLSDDRTPPPAELAQDLDLHLADLAVGQALRASIANRGFELVRAII